MVKVLSSRVSGPLEPHASGFAEELLLQGYSCSGAGQHVCFIAHLDRWLSAAGPGLGELSGQVIERYLAECRAAEYVQYWSAKALEHLAQLDVLPVAQEGFRSEPWRSGWVVTATTCSSSAA